MKGFERSNRYFSLCGLNCGLCPMNLSGHCGGCGAGNQSCKLARCSMEHGNIEYCFQCGEFPCQKYDHIADFDSFITHQNQLADIEKAQLIGIAAYNIEQAEKIKVLNHLLSNYNDGRKKNLFCIAVNLLDLDSVKELISELESLEAFHKLSKNEPITPHWVMGSSSLSLVDHSKLGVGCAENYLLLGTIEAEAVSLVESDCFIVALQHPKCDFGIVK